MEEFNPIPKTPAQIAALDRAYQDLMRDYPDHYVSYLDEWDGDVLTRTVVAAGATAAEYCDRMKALPKDVRRRVGAIRVSAPDAPLFASFRFDPSA